MKNEKTLIIFASALIFLFMTMINNVSTYAQFTQNGFGVKITSPIKDEQIPVGKNNNLKISGISTDNATADCQVYVILNNVKPYQKAVATGPTGVNDYSKWNFMLNSNYATIKEGVNKITAKLSCIDNPSNNLTKYYSVNITGVKAAEKQLPLSSPDNNTDNMDKDRVETTIPSDSDIKSKEHKPDESTKENNNEEKTNPLIIPFGAG